MQQKFRVSCYVLLIQILNPFSLNPKLSNQNKHEMIYMLDRKNILYPKIEEIVWKFIAKDKKIYNKLRNNLCQFKEIFEYVYSMVYPKIYCTTKRRSFNLYSTFLLIFKAYKDEKKSLNSSVKILKFF